MDQRNFLSPGTRLAFPGMECTVRALAGFGSNAAVYEGWYPDQEMPELEHRVLIKELFPYHPSGGIYRAADGTIQWDDSAAELMELHRSSFQRGNEVHLRLLRNFPSELGVNLNTFSRNHTLYTVLGFSGGRSMQQELDTAATFAFPIAIHIRRMIGVLDALESFHASGYLHLDISPDNILLIGDGKRERVNLIDFNTVHTLHELHSGAALYYSEKEGYSAPELRAGAMGRLGAWSDLYSVAAVFFRCVSGRSLTVLDTSQAGVPDISDVPVLQELPGTAVSMLRHILRRGLSTTIGRRYQNIPAMRKDLEELQDRVAGKGITHWALWESGRANIRRIVRDNPAFSYLRDTDALYPLRCLRTGGKSEDFSSAFRTISMPEGNHVLLLGSGGIGKTTALLSTAFHHGATYSPTEPAFFYIPLYGWKEGGAHFLKNRILESMLFRPETASMEMARHELLQLLSTPAHTKWGERPRLLLMLDGLNEVGGDQGPLLEEIRELSGLPGVRVCVTSRVAALLPGFDTLQLAPLRDEDVRGILSGKGLVPPEHPELLQSLRTPLMLSLYVNTATEEKKQLTVRSQDELLDAYFSALTKKAVGDEGPDGTLFWRVQAAIAYVLPELAKVLREKGSAASDSQLLPVVERCWKRLSGSAFRKVFPAWIGHLSDIRGGAPDAEAWYGEIVHGLLWRKLGLIVRDAQGNYRLFHELAELYLLRQRRLFAQKFARRQAFRSCCCALLFAAALGASYQWLYVPYVRPLLPREQTVYDVEKTRNILGTAFHALMNSLNQCDSMKRLLEVSGEDPLDEDSYEYYRNICLRCLDNRALIDVGRTMRRAEDLVTTGEVMPYSRQPLDLKEFHALLSMGKEQAEAYRQSIAQMDRLRSDGALWERYSEAYLEELSVALDADYSVLKKRYYMVLAPEFSQMQRSEEVVARVEYEESMKTLAMTSLDLDEIQTYERIRFVAWNAVTANPVHSIFP